MGSLFMAILCSASIALIFRFSEHRDMNRYALTSANYVTACLISIAFWSAAPATLFTPNSLPAVIIGTAAGLVFYLSFIYYQKSVRHHGASLSGAFAKLGILVPMVLSILLWREIPAMLQWIGIVLALASILLANWPGASGWRSAFRRSLILLFLCGGLAEFTSKIFQKYSVSDAKPVFLFLTFFTALIFSGTKTVRIGLPVTCRDILTGVAVGVPNLFSSFFMIDALQTIPAPVAFPVFSAGTIIVIVAGARVLFRERISPREFAAIILTIIALILING